MKMIGSMDSKVPFTVDPLPVSSLERGQGIPLGEPSTNYTLRVYVDITTPFGAQSTMYKAIQSKPPENISKATDHYLKRMEANKVTDPESVFEDAESVVSIQGYTYVPPGVQPPKEDLELMDNVVELMDEAAQYAPVTTGTVMQRSTVLMDVVNAGARTETVMNSIESTVDDAVAAGIYTLADPAPVAAGMQMLAGMLPDFDKPLSTTITADTLGGGRRLQRARSKALQQRSLAEDPGHIKSTIFGRQEQNHPAAAEEGEGEVIRKCPTAYCDTVLLHCAARHQKKGSKSRWLLDLGDSRPRVDWFICCDSVNPGTKCSHPPCWFRGPECPMPEVEEGSEFAQRSRVTNVACKEILEYWRAATGIGSGQRSLAIEA
jgi:hypothetical protein